MTDLSPAAQAVLDAFLKAPCDNELSVAAALRAAADQVVPEEIWLGTEETCFAYYLQRRNTRREILAIAAELERTE